MDFYIKNKSFKPFRSPIDGSVIKNPKQLEEHKKVHKVIQVQELGEKGGLKQLNTPPPKSPCTIKKDIVQTIKEKENG